MNTDKEIFKGKNLSNLFEEIYDNSKETKSQVKSLIGELKPLVESAGDATLIVPLIKDYLEIGVKNDEHLIKLATVIQRLEAIEAKGSGDDFDFSDLEALLEEQDKVSKEVDESIGNKNNLESKND